MIGVSMFYNVLQEKPISHDVSSQATVVDPFGYPHSSPANRSAIAARMQVGRVTKLTSCQDSAPPGKSQIDENAETQMASVITRTLRQNWGNFLRKQSNIAYSWVLADIWKHNLSLIESFINSRRLDLVPPRCSPWRREAPRVTGKLTFGYPPKPGPWRSIHRQPHMRLTSWLASDERSRARAAPWCGNTWPVRIAALLYRIVICRPNPSPSGDGGLSRRGVPLRVHPVFCDAARSAQGRPDRRCTLFPRHDVSHPARHARRATSAPVEPPLNWPVHVSSPLRGRAAFLGGAG